MTTPPSLLAPADLATPPDLHDCRPLCSCGAIPVFPLVGMHGDGLTWRRVPWPVLDDAGTLEIVWVIAVGRRYWCPVCRTTMRVAHPGLRRGALYGAAVIAALLHVLAPKPMGQGHDDAHAHQLVHGRPLPFSERARSGRPRWSSLRRWLGALGALWPTVALPEGDTTTRLCALLATFGVGAPLHEVLDRAVLAHARGGLAM